MLQRGVMWTKQHFNEQVEMREIERRTKSLEPETLAVTTCDGEMLSRITSYISGLLGCRFCLKESKRASKIHDF